MTAAVPDAVALTQELVRIRSVNDPDNDVAESVVAARIAEIMRSFGWTVDVVEVAPGRPNVVAIIEGGGGDGATLMFEGHTDVVTEGSADTWTMDPYGGDIVDGRLYGRGSADMKSGVAAMIAAARQVQMAGPFPGRIVVAALVDEEGMMLGAKHFAATPLASTIDAAIVCEPEAGEICITAKGALRLSIELFGVMAHGAMPAQAKNPIFCIGEILASLFEYQVELAAEHVEHEHLGPVYITPTVVQAGSLNQINVVPAFAQIALDIRTIPGVDHRGVVRRVTQIAERASTSQGVRSEVQVLDDRPTVEVSETHPLVRSMVVAHEAVTGQPAKFGGVPGATDGTILFRDAGIPNLVYGPGGKWIAHQSDEFVDISEIYTAAEVYARAATLFLTRTDR
jgi:succinyl-diaminopimelate desuccinylase